MGTTRLMAWWKYDFADSIVALIRSICAAHDNCCKQAISPMTYPNPLAT